MHQQLNRSIVSTDPEEMLERGDKHNTLFHQLEQVETAILQGQALELSRSHNPYGSSGIGMITLWPLQIIYHDIAWYLISEDLETDRLGIRRLNPFFTPRSFREFMLWVYRHLHNAQVLSPPELVAQHRKAAQALIARYES